MTRRKATLFYLMIFLCLPMQAEQDSSPSQAWRLLKKMVDIPGVSEKEDEVVDFIQSTLPSSFEVKRDEMNNIWFSAGAGRPHLLFVSHTDEIGFIVEGITPRGTLKVERKGGFFPFMYEARAVNVYTAERTIQGVVIPRADYLKQARTTPLFGFEDVEIYIGVSSEEEARAMGAKEGAQITIKKKIIELGEAILATRSVDDRAGCASMLAAVQRIDWDAIKGKTVTFAWDVQEETGLVGASRLARTLDADYVFPVDTFVSSDGPFDSKRYAWLPLGKGAVLRAVDSSNITPHHMLEKMLKIARDNNIPVQLGNTRGGNDGSVFVPWGAVDIPLSWPGTYSHSFIEKIHREDLEAMTRLIIAVVEDW